MQNVLILLLISANKKHVASIYNHSLQDLYNIYTQHASLFCYLYTFSAGTFSILELVTTTDWSKLAATFRSLSLFTDSDTGENLLWDFRFASTPAKIWGQKHCQNCFLDLACPIHHLYHFLSHLIIFSHLTRAHKWPVFPAPLPNNFPPPMRLPQFS